MNKKEKIDQKEKKMVYTASEARKNLAEIINRAAYGKERIVVTYRGRRCFAFVPMEDYELSLYLKKQRREAEALEKETQKEQIPSQEEPV